MWAGRPRLQSREGERQHAVELSCREVRYKGSKRRPLIGGQFAKCAYELIGSRGAESARTGAQILQNLVECANSTSCLHLTRSDACHRRMHETNVVDRR